MELYFDYKPKIFVQRLGIKTECNQLYSALNGKVHQHDQCNNKSHVFYENINNFN